MGVIFQILYKNSVNSTAIDLIIIKYLGNSSHFYSSYLLVQRFQT